MFISKDDISDEIKQKIASEINSGATAFVAKMWTKESKVLENSYTLRWFSPTLELKLCGHATMASAMALFDHSLKTTGNYMNEIKFVTKFCGTVEAIVNNNEEPITINLPINDCQPLNKSMNPWIEDMIKTTLGPEIDFNSIEDIQYSIGTKYLLLKLRDESETEELIHKISPDFQKLLKIETNGSVIAIIVTEKPIQTKNVDLLCRLFCCWLGFDEDYVCGSAHTVLAPFWRREYKKNGIEKERLINKQCSQRGGTLICDIIGQRVELTGKTKTFVKGFIEV